MKIYIKQDCSEVDWKAVSETHGFRRMKTGMARFKERAAMKEHGFTE
jgi:hypothetical protein